MQANLLGLVASMCAEPSQATHIVCFSGPRAQVLFTAELRRRLPGGCGVVAAAVHPGEVMTDVVRTLPRPLQAAYRVAMLPFCLTPAEGARMPGTLTFKFAQSHRTA